MLKSLVERIDLLAKYFAINKDNEITKNGFEIKLKDRAERLWQRTHGEAVAINVIAHVPKILQ